MSQIPTMRDAQSLKGLQELTHAANLFLDMNVVCVEYGCYSGESTAVFAKAFKKVYAVDPWENGYDKDDYASEQVEMSEVERMFDNRLKNFKTVEKHKCKSLDFIIPPDANMFYVDANHTYEAVTNDIHNILENMDKCGKPYVIAGHDYHTNWKGVMQAVDENFNNVIKFSDTSWMVFA